MNTDRTLARASRALATTLQAGLLVTGLTFSTLIAQAQSPAATQSDTQVQSAVTAALAADPQLKGQQVSATVSQGVVTLSGSVADDVQRTAAEQTVAQVAGVRSIDDGLAVGSQQNVASADQTQTAPDQTTGVSTPDQGQVSTPPNSSSSNSNAQQAPNMPPPPPADTTQQQYPQQNQYPQQPGQYGQYPPQGPYAQQRGQYPPPPPQNYVPGVTPEKQNASGPVTLTPGLLLNVRASEPLSTARLKDGDYVQFTAASDVYQNGVVAIPRGAVLTGQVVESKNAGPFGGSPKLDLKLTTLTLGAQTYPLTSDVWSSQGPNKAGYTAGNAIGGAAFGAIIGAIAGGGTGAGIGAVAGGAGGALVSGATRGPRLDLPAETMLQFHLNAPLTVQPVSYSEAERLAASVPQQPVLRTRPVYSVAPYPYYARPYYVYPAPYYYYYGR